MSDDPFASRVTKLGALADPIRRALYRFVAEQPGSVSRDQAAEGIGIPRHTVKFHLDRLVEEGLLVTEFRRLTGRSGPGAGRPAKLYRRSRKEVTVSVPSRRYDLAGQVLADAVERALDGTPMEQAILDAADNAARIVVEAAGTPVGEPTEEPAEQPDERQHDEPLDRALDRALEVLDSYGYEPRPDGSDTRLSNCPYDRVAADHRALVCPMNREFVAGVLRHVGCGGHTALATEPGTGCCVRIVASDSSPA